MYSTIDVLYILVLAFTFFCWLWPVLASEDVAGHARRIKLAVLGKKGLDYPDGTPVTFGVPFPDGELRRGHAVRLVDAEGNPLPVQTSCMTTWSNDLKYVKWLLVDTQVSRPQAGESPIFLEYGIGVEEPVLPKEKISLKREGDYYAIDTGKLRARIRCQFPPWEKPEDSDFFSECRVQEDDGEWRQAFSAGNCPRLYITDTEGRCYDSHVKGIQPLVKIEDSGPMRVSVCIKGYHNLRNGPRLCPYIVRMHFFAGSRDIRIYHTFVFDQNPYQVELSSVGIRFPFDAGGSLRAAIGGDAKVHSADEFERLAILQTDDRSYQVRVNDDESARGKRAGGWASLCGDRASAVVAIPDFWQEYPNGFAIDDGGINAEIWPQDHTEPLCFASPFDVGPRVKLPAIDKGLDEETFRDLAEKHPDGTFELKSVNLRKVEDVPWVERMVETYLKDKPKTYSDAHVNIGIAMNLSGGLGAAKTPQLHLRLSASAIPDGEAEALAAIVQEPLLVSAEPAYICSTGVFGHVLPAGHAAFKQADEDMAFVIRSAVDETVEPCRLYGMMRYGNMPGSHGSAGPLLYAHYKKKGQLEKALRYIGPYNNEANDQIMGAWLNFVHTGRRHDFLVARRYSRSVADVSFAHVHPTNPFAAGTMHYHGGHQWSGGYVQSHGVIGGIMTDYYFTGNRRLLDISEEAADRLVRLQTPGGVIFHPPDQGRLLREITGPISVLLEVYQATWNDKYGRLAENSLNWLLRTMNENLTLPNSISTDGVLGDEALIQPPELPEQSWGNMYHVYELTMRFFPSQTLAEHVVAKADHFMWKLPLDLSHYESGIACLAYALTGDACYAAYAKYHIENPFHELIERYRKAGMMDSGLLNVLGSMPRLEKTVHEAAAADPAGFEEDCKAWLEKRLQMPPGQGGIRQDKAPFKNIGRLSTDPHPPLTGKYKQRYELKYGKVKSEAP